MWMELKFLLCCQQTYRDLDADSRGKQSPHQERVKEHELWHGMLRAKQMGHAVGGGQREGGDGPCSPCFLHILVTQPRARILVANHIDLCK